MLNVATACDQQHSPRSTTACAFHKCSACLAWQILQLHEHFQHLCSCWGMYRQDQVEQIAKKLDGPLLVQKGAKDGISDGSQTIYCEGNGSKRRAGGQVCFLATFIC